MISAIVPAYNEEKTIGQIVAILKKTPLVEEVIVVDDGSKDATADIALKGGAKVIRLPQNLGKGEALALGVEKAKNDLLLFLDADLLGLKEEHIELLARPVLENGVDITIGSIDRGKALNRWMRKFESPFSGLRVLKRDFWEQIPGKFKKGYFIESALSHFAKEKKLRTKGLILPGLKHSLKEKKRGLWLGLSQRLKMMGEIVLANVILKTHFLKNYFFSH